jgi:hypothetical protein
LKKNKRNWILLCILVVLGICGLFFYASRDIPPPDVSDLALERPVIPTEKNAFTYFNAATNSFYWPTNRTFVSDYLKGMPVDDAVIQDLISRNTETFRLINEGIRCDICLVPEIDGLDGIFPYLSKWMATAKMLSVKARHDRLAGNYTEATDSCITLLRFGNLIQKDPGSLVHYLGGKGILNLGLTQIQDLEREKSFPLAHLSKLADTLASLGPFDSGVIRAFKGENKQTALFFEQIQHRRFWWKWTHLFDYMFQLNRTTLIYANLSRDAIKNAPRCYADMKYPETRLGEGFKSTFRLLTHPNGLGKILAELWMPTLDIPLYEKCKLECNVSATRILVALNAYQKMEDRLPDTLQALVPVYLPAVPNDPFDGKPFRYSPALRIVYSVGKDLKDSGGSSLVPPDKLAGFSSPDRWDTEDAVFQINPGSSN